MTYPQKRAFVLAGVAVAILLIFIAAAPHGVIDGVIRAPSEPASQWNSSGPSSQSADESCATNQVCGTFDSDPISTYGNATIDTSGNWFVELVWTVALWLTLVGPYAGLGVFELYRWYIRKYPRIPPVQPPSNLPDEI